MDCQLFERQAQRGIDGLLATHEHEDMLHHAAGCPACAALLQDMEALEGLLGAQLQPMEAPPGFAEAVMAALPAPYRKPVLLRLVPRRPAARFGSIAAAAVLLIAAGVYSLWPAQPAAGPGVGPIDPAIVAENPAPQPQPAVQPTPVNPQPQPQPPLDPAEDPTEETPQDPTEEQPQNPAEEPPVVAQDPAPYTTSVDLPKPSYNPQSEGMLSLTLLAGYEDCDAQLPSINEEGLVVFYIRYKGVNHQWTQTLGAEAAPEYVGQVKTLPSLAEITGSQDESTLAGYPYVSALSPDGRVLAVNRSGEYPGVWLFEATAALETLPEQGVDIAKGHGGGKILSWSPDGNKLLYTDDTGKLFVHYLYMPAPNSMELYKGSVSCASWAVDSTAVVFAGKEEKNAKSGIYAIEIP